MSAAFHSDAVRLPSRAARKFAFSLLVALPILALGLAHTIGASSANSVASPEFGYAEWAAK